MADSHAKFIAPGLEELAPLFPAYELQAFIAQGGMGAVYKARQISLDRPVAIKILPREFGSDAGFRASFEAEAKVMARLNHPNLIAVYDFGSVQGMLFIVMEYVQGKALYYSAHRKAIDPCVALGLIASVAHGLAHAHDAGIIHRDIKPANILLDPKARPKIGDFGLARPLDPGQQEAFAYGTPGYTAPEVYARDHHVDQRSDIFSIGAVLYELLTGNPPKENSHSLQTGLDPKIDSILLKATHPRPAHRHSSVESLAQEIEAIIPKISSSDSSRSSNATAPSLTAQLRTSQASTPESFFKSPIAIFFYTLILLLLIGGLVYLSMQPSGKSGRNDSPTQTLLVSKSFPDLNNFRSRLS